MKIHRLPWLQLQKMQWLDCQFYLHGKVKNSHYKEWFGVSRATAQNDINLYGEYSGQIYFLNDKNRMWLATKDWWPVCGGDKEEVWKAFLTLRGLLIKERVERENVGCL